MSGELTKRGLGPTFLHPHGGLPIPSKLLLNQPCSYPIPNKPQLTMASPTTGRPRAIPASAKIFIQVELPNVPGYVYHDRFDAYLVRNDTKLSMVTFDLSTDAGNENILFGAATLSLPLQPPENKEDDSAAEWTKLNGLRGWHYNPASIGDFVRNVGRTHPSIMYRSVLVDGEYKIEAVGGDAYRVHVKVISLIGEKEMDGKTKDTVPGGGAVFQITFKRDSGAWYAVQTEGIVMQEGEAKTVW